MPSAEQNYGHRYESKRRLASYWHQIEETERLGAKSVLLVGKGSGTSEYLLEHGSRQVITLDIARELHPDVIADVTSLPFRGGAFDVVVCCQVLEHLPFDAFPNSLRELRRVARVGAVLSLPDQARVLRVDVKLPRFSRQLMLSLPHLRRRDWRFDGQHHWEVNARHYELTHINDIVSSTGFQIEDSYRVFENPYHRFWRLRCK